MPFKEVFLEANHFHRNQTLIKTLTSVQFVSYEDNVIMRKAIFVQFTKKCLADLLINKSSIQRSHTNRDRT